MYRTYFNAEKKITEQVENRLTQPCGIPPSGRSYREPRSSKGADMIDVFLDIEEHTQDTSFEILMAKKIAQYLLSDYTSPEPDYIYRFICMNEKHKLQLFITYLKHQPNLLDKLLKQRTPEGQSLIELARQVDQIPSSTYSEDVSFEFILTEAQKDLCKSIASKSQENRERKSLKS